MALKGKEIAGTKKRKSENGDKSGSSNERKRKNPGVLQFFDVAAEVDDVEEESESESDDDDRAQVSAGSVDKVDAGQKGKSGFGRTHNLPFLPKEEELSDGELELLLEERYKPGSQHVVYADDKHENKGSGDEGSFMQALDNTTIWRVKCTVGRERRSALCLIQKFVDRKSLGQKLQIASAFSPDHVKGYIYIEAEKEVDVLEACKGLTTLYTSRISPVPKNEFAHLFSIRKTSIEVSPGTWVRVKNGQYRGDLAQVVTFDHAKKRATVKVVPRIDLQALAKKLAGGGTVKQTAVPTARVISSKDLEEFARYIQLKRDRQTGQICQTIDGLKFKDGYLYKKVSMESISYVDVVPSTDELLKFKPYKKDASDDAEWLSHLYGEQRKKRLSECSNGATKGSEGTSGSKKGDQFQLHDLVFFGPKDFGVIIRVESDGFQILKYDEVEGAEVLNVELHEIRNSSSDKKFSTMDRQMKTISLNDTVRVLEGPFTGKEGIVKHICKSTTFIYDESQLENGGYFCAKSQMCENISNSKEGDVFGAPGLEDSTGSPKSPELFKKPWEEKENTRDFNSRRNGDRDGAFSVGQTLRIRVGPLKGHLCRVVAIYRSDITVKVDSQTKVLSVKCEHLSEVGMKSNFMTRNDGFGTQGEASGAPTESNGWGGSASLTTGRNSWPDFTAPEFLVDTSIKNPFDSLVTDDPEKGLDPWGSKATSKKATDSWGNTAGFGGDVGKEGDDPWGSKEASKNATNSWGDAASFGGDPDKGKEGDDPWGSKEASKKATNSWGNAASFGGDPDKGKEGDDLWGSKEVSKKSTDSWGNAANFGGDPPKGKGDEPWGSKATSEKTTDSWGNAASFGGDPHKGTEGDDPWGSKGSSKKATDSWGNGTGFGVGQHSSWGNSQSEDNSFKNKQDCNDNTRKTADYLNKGKTVSENNGSEWASQAGVQDSWGSKGTSEKGIDNWGSKATSEKATGSWGTAIVDSSEKCKSQFENEGKDWGAMAQGAGKSSHEDTWGKAVESSVKGDMGKGWGNSAGSWTQSEATHGSQDNPWSKPKAFTVDEATPWSKGTTTTTGDGWNSQKGMGTEQGSRDNQQDGWNRPRDFDGGRGSGGRRGRGGFRGNRDQSGRGRSFGRGRSSGWNNENQSSWGNSSQDPGANKNQDEGWNKPKFGFGEGRGGNRDGAKSFDAGGSNWKSCVDQDTGSKFSNLNNGGGSTWNTSNTVGRNQSSGWSATSSMNEVGGSKGQDWKSGENKASGEMPSDGDGKASSWKSGGTDAGASSWNAPKDSRGGRPSDWNQAVPEASGSKNQEEVWKTGKGSDADLATGWSSGNASGGGQSDGWNKGSNTGWKTRKGSDTDVATGWSSGNASGGGQSDGWNKGSNTGWKTGEGSDTDVATGWSSGNASCGGQSDGWNKGANTGWKTGKGSDTDIATGWSSGNASRGGQSAGWDKGANKGDGSGYQSNDWKKREFGNRDDGNNWRGGRSSGWGRGGGEDFSNRGFGRGRSSGSPRGGFGNNRGRGRRDQSGGWNGEKTNGENQSFGWSKGNDDSCDWKSSKGADSWNQGGSGNGQWNSWNKESSSTKETGGTSNQALGWSSQDASKDTADGRAGKQAESWGRSNAASVTQLASWSKSSGAKEEASGAERQADAWGIAAASSWGMEKDGSNGKGGW